MNNSSRKFEFVVWSALILLIIGIVGAFVMSKLNSTTRQFPIIGQVGDFHLTNQLGQPISMTNLHDHVWITDVIFTSCPGPCAKMTKHLSEIQNSLTTNQPIKLISFTSNPEYDTPSELKKYAERFGADANRWWFLTGDKGEIRRLATNDLKFVVVEKQPDQRENPDDLFIHSTWFVLVDKHGQVRGWTDEQGSLHAYWDSEDAEARASILAAAQRIAKEK
ncbi:SCO family protein [Pedosphaera parvula]|uniref:Electron transport protein SCO1/SenC n=1 Tax=Pedosphaera parvula (strain Ellin514) TaxID=320771 RepID=B9XRS4_PEDPL|nr:SCO family protein [Pedosphaera parvula]EEF57489.1 electron transport protein SCO1/SenC [Pedosphaera parvula Ellin514]